MSSAICQLCRAKWARHAAPSLALALFSLLLSFYFAPWFYAGSHPVVVDADLSGGAALDAVLEDGWTANLVRAGDGMWTTELPPRKSYTLSLKAEGGDCVLRSADIQDLHARPPVRTLFSWKAENQGGEKLGAGQQKNLCADVETGSGSFAQTFVSLFFLLSLFYYGFVYLWKTGEFRFEAGRGFAPWQWGVLLAMALVHLWLICTATPMFWTSDSIGYASKALSLYRSWKYDTGGIYYEITRAPGAPLIEALAWKLFGFSLSSIVLLQGILYCLACLTALDAVARASARRTALLFSPLVIFCPQALSSNRIVASESPFLIFALLGLAFMLRFAVAKKSRGRWLWMLAATLSLMYASLVRMNGVALLAFPIVILVREAVQALRSRGSLRRRFAGSAIWLLPMAGVALTLFCWSWRNYKVRDWFAPSDIPGLSAAEATFKSGLLDLRSAEPDDAVYKEYAVKRRDSAYYAEAWALASIYQKQLADRGPVDMHAAKQVDGMLADFASRSNAACPWQSKVTRFSRIFRWGLFMDRDANFQPFGKPLYPFLVYSDSDWAYTNEVLSGWISPELTLEQKPLGTAQKAWNVVQKIHPALLIFGILLGFVAYGAAAVRGWHLVMLMLLTYFGNLLLIAWLGVVISRLILVLEPFLWLGLALAAGKLMRDFETRRKHDIPA